MAAVRLGALPSKQLCRPVTAQSISPSSICVAVIPVLPLAIRELVRRIAALSPFSTTGLTDPEDVVPFIRHLVSDGWWIAGQTILINGGYTTR